MKKTKAKVSEEKGDKDFKKEKFKKALQHYRVSQEFDPLNVSIYDKLIEAHKKNSDSWTEEDFSLSLEWTMKKQELENPQLKRVHARLDPVFAQISRLIREMLMALDETTEARHIEQIKTFEGKAIYPLIEALLSFKKSFVGKGKIPPFPPLAQKGPLGTKGGEGGFKK